jgi:3-dehydroquinate synthase
VGGGVVTDLSGYVASVFMRGLRFGFVPTSLLAMVDAAIGGKNGIDVGLYKNMVGTIRQPEFILYDEKLLGTLPVKEWRNGFAEIIKHACIMDKNMFRELMSHDLEYYRSDTRALSELIVRNARLKIRVVQSDEFEKGERKLLNFGHTVGHAIENEYKLMHGQAVAVGMMAAAKFSTQVSGFDKADQVKEVIRKYELPASLKFDANKIFKLMISDKKRAGKDINFILLSAIGNAEVVKIPLKQLKKMVGEL